MNFYIKKIISMTLLASFLGLNFCFANSYPQQYSNNTEAQLEQIFQEQQNQKLAQEITKNDGYFKAGYNLAIELEDEINSETANIGDEIKARLLFPLEIDNKIIIPEGAIVSGKIVKLQKKGMWYQNAKAQVVFDKIECTEDYELPIVANIKTKDNSKMLFGEASSRQFNQIFSLLATISAGGALSGFGFGLLTPYALVGGVIGGFIGFVSGIACLFFKKGQAIHIPNGIKLIITLEEDVAVSDFEI